MNETAALLVDHVLPVVPIRQWVVSFPFSLRFWLARRPDLLSVCLAIIQRVISRSYQRRAKHQGFSGDLKTGAVTFIQRFGSSLNLNPHLHILAVDGVFEISEADAVFRPAPSVTDPEVIRCVQAIAIRCLKALERKGIMFARQHDFDESPEPLPLYDQLQVASVQGRSLLDRHGQRTQRRGSLLFLKDIPWSTFGRLCASAQGFSLHAQTQVPAKKRDRLEKLCRYLARPAVANERLSFSADGNHVHLRLKKPFRDGTTALSFTPMELMEKLAALVPPPRVHLVRYSGILAPHDRHRALVVPKPPDNPSPTRGPNSAHDENESETSKRRRFSWAKLLARVFTIDVETCTSCGGTLRIIAAITERSVIQKILNHLHLPAKPPAPAPARPPPQVYFEFDQRLERNH